MSHTTLRLGWYLKQWQFSVIFFPLYTYVRVYEYKICRKSKEYHFMGLRYMKKIFFLHSYVCITDHHNGMRVFIEKFLLISYVYTWRFTENFILPYLYHHSTYLYIYIQGWWKIKEKMFVAYLLQYYYCEKKRNSTQGKSKQADIAEWIIYFYRSKACVCVFVFYGRKAKVWQKNNTKRKNFSLCVLYVYMSIYKLHATTSTTFIQFKWHYLKQGFSGQGLV